MIERFAAAYDETLVALLEDSETPPLERLKRYFAAGRDHMHECDHATGCLIGNLGQELSGQNDTFRDALNLVFQRWEQRFIRCLQDAQRRGDIATHTAPASLASFILSGWEGAILRAKTLKSVEPMEHFEAILFQQVLVAKD